MSKFLLAYLLIYGGVNAYLGWRLARALQPGSVALLGLVAGLLALVTAPIMAQLLARLGWQRTAQSLALLGAVWMAIAFWFFMFGLVLEVWNASTALLQLWQPHRWSVLRPLSPMLMVRILAGIVGVLVLWGSIEARWLQVSVVRLQSPVLPPGSAPIRVVQLSDLHLGFSTGAAHVQRVIKVLRRLQPDLLVCTGDFLDVATPWVEGVASEFSQLSAPLGKYAIMGNHEFYAGVDAATQVLEAAGFSVLRQQCAEIDSRLCIVGLDDPARRRSGGAGAQPSEGELLQQALATGKFVLLLKHRPEFSDPARQPPLQISGHTHRGQIFPFNLFIYLQYKQVAGLFRGAQGYLYVNRGTGCWGPPFRVMSPPEITVFELSPAAVETVVLVKGKRL